MRQLTIEIKGIVDDLIVASKVNNAVAASNYANRKPNVVTVLQKKLDRMYSSLTHIYRHHAYLILYIYRLFQFFNKLHIKPQPVNQLAALELETQIQHLQHLNKSYETKIHNLLLQLKEREEAWQSYHKSSTNDAWITFQKLQSALIRIDLQDAKLADLQRTIAEHQSLAKQHVNEQNANTSKISSLQKQVVELEAREQQLQTRIQDLTREVEKAVAEAKQKSKDADSKQSQLIKSNEQITQLKSSEQQLSIQVDTQKVIVKQHLKNLDDLQDKLTLAAQKHKREQEASYKQLETTRLNLESKNSELALKFDALSRHNADVESRLTAALEELAALRAAKAAEEATNKNKEKKQQQNAVQEVAKKAEEENDNDEEIVTVNPLVNMEGESLVSSVPIQSAEQDHHINSISKVEKQAEPQQVQEPVSEKVVAPAEQQEASVPVSATAVVEAPVAASAVPAVKTPTKRSRSSSKKLKSVILDEEQDKVAAPIPTATIATPELVQPIIQQLEAQVDQQEQELQQQISPQKKRKSQKSPAVSPLKNVEKPVVAQVLPSSNLSQTPAPQKQEEEVSATVNNGNNNNNANGNHKEPIVNEEVQATPIVEAAPSASVSVESSPSKSPAKSTPQKVPTALDFPPLGGRSPSQKPSPSKK